MGVCGLRLAGDLRTFYWRRLACRPEASVHLEGSRSLNDGAGRAFRDRWLSCLQRSKREGPEKDSGSVQGHAAGGRGQNADPGCLGLILLSVFLGDTCLRWGLGWSPHHPALWIWGFAASCGQGQRTPMDVVST